MKTLLESANHFLNYTSNPSIFQSPMDVVYFSQAVENYLPYLTESNEVGHHMMDMVANILGKSEFHTVCLKLQNSIFLVELLVNNTKILFAPRISN